MDKDPQGIQLVSNTVDSGITGITIDPKGDWPVPKWAQNGSDGGIKFSLLLPDDTKIQLSNWAI